jgi:hypothetical protein
MNLPSAIGAVLDAERRYPWGSIMATVYIKPRPKGRREGKAVERYVVEDHADNVLGFGTHLEAADWAKRIAWPDV